MVSNAFKDKLERMEKTEGQLNPLFLRISAINCKGEKLKQKQLDKFLSQLRESKLTNLSALRTTPRKMWWQYIHGKRNLDEQFSMVWINKLLIHYQVNDATKAAFLFYQSLFYLPRTGAKVDLRIHKTFSENDKKKLKKNLGWKKGDVIIGVLIKGGKEIQFELAKLEDLGITDAKPFSKYEENAVKSNLVTDIKQSILETQKLVQELEGNWLK